MPLFAIQYYNALKLSGSGKIEAIGEVAEWLNAQVSKTCIALSAIEGSNPSLSALASTSLENAKSSFLKLRRGIYAKLQKILYICFCHLSSKYYDNS